MKCTNCGAYIPDGEIYCSNCGAEIQIVPDYNPLDDVLAKEVKGSIGAYTEQLSVDEGRARRRTEALSHSTGGVRQRSTTGNMRRPASGEEGKKGVEVRKNTGTKTGADLRRSPDTKQLRRTEEEKKRQQLRRRQRQKKKKRLRILMLAGMILVAVALGYFLYAGSYTGIIRSARRAMESGDYTKAESKFNKAISRDSTRAEAYTGLSDVYRKQGKQDDLEKAEQVFLDAIDGQKNNSSLYKAAIQFYLDTKQESKISELLDGCTDSVLSDVKEYVSNPPQFSLEEGSYEEVQQVSLSSDGEKIYYTTDGSEPSTSSTEYKEPILLNEGENQVRAISVNKKGIPSLEASRSYEINIPIADAPAVSPSTGQYDKQMEITIQVPEGYKAYYTTDNTEPTTSSTLYTGPIQMPEGQTIFSAVLVNSQGKMTQITKRNYVLEIEE